MILISMSSAKRFDRVTGPGGVCRNALSMRLAINRFSSFLSGFDGAHQNQRLNFDLRNGR